MILKKYDNFIKNAGDIALKYGDKMSEGELDEFAGEVVSDSSLNVPSAIYGRDAFALVMEAGKNMYRIAALQINTFGAGIFSDAAAKFYTPVLMTIKLHGSKPYLNPELKDCMLSMDEFYLGKGFCGSKGPLCDRAVFDEALKKMFSASKRGGPVQRITSRLIESNYVCHHIAETLGYAYGALDSYWKRGKKMSFMCAATGYDEKKDELRLDIVDNFSSDRMRCLFKTPQYGKLTGKADDFIENKGLVLMEVEYKGDIQTFYVPSGFHKMGKKLFGENVRVVTTQHIIEHVLADYYKRRNSFVVANTFQVLEHLSRGLMARRDGNKDEGAKFIREASSCKGQYPEMDLNKVIDKEDEKYPVFASEFSYGMFFRPPVIV